MNELVEFVTSLELVDAQIGLASLLELSIGPMQFWKRRGKIKKGARQGWDKNALDPLAELLNSGGEGIDGFDDQFQNNEALVQTSKMIHSDRSRTATGKHTSITRKDITHDTVMGKHLEKSTKSERGRRERAVVIGSAKSSRAGG
jgi:hypothetical protein